MQALELGAFAHGGVVLCIGAHCDDIEIGCGGTLLRLLDANPALEVHYLVLCSDALRKREALDAARRLLGDAAEKRVRVHAFRDGFLPWSGGEVKECFEALKRSVTPDLILTHMRGDLHQDHRLASEVTWNTFRDHCILEYEIPKYDGDFGSPNVLIALDEETAERKIDAVMNHFPSQHERAWFDPDLFRAVLRLRGMEANAPERFAEGFYATKVVL